tara:strand:+ start:181 stop:438 length:258 start_codon:yes stop_codon:yes gene_type:complete
MPIQEIPAVEFQVDNIIDAFEDTMKQVFDEDPGLFETRFGNGEVKVHSDRASWHGQVTSAGVELREEINRLIENFEVRLHQGEFA